MKHDFHVGDRVKVTGHSEYTHIRRGMTGVVCYITEEFPHAVFIRWDLSRPRNPFHDCADYSHGERIPHCEKGYGWNVPCEIVSLIESVSELAQDFDISVDELFNLL